MKIVLSGKIINLLILSLNYHTRSYRRAREIILFHPLALKIFLSLFSPLIYSFICLLYTRKLLNNFPKHFHEFIYIRICIFGVGRWWWRRYEHEEQYDKHFISTATEWCYDNFHNHWTYTHSHTHILHHHHHSDIYAYHKFYSFHSRENP